VESMDIPRWIEQQVGVRPPRVHDAIYKGTNGRIGHRFMPGIPPNLLLHTTGRRDVLLNSLCEFDIAYCLIVAAGGSGQGGFYPHRLR
jgi:F420H(2)-dependent quinone reductase